MAAHNMPARMHHPAPLPYHQQMPQPKLPRVDPSAPLPTSFAPVQNPDHPTWPEEIQRNSVASPERPADKLARTASRKRRVSGTGQAPRRSQIRSYPAPEAPNPPQASNSRSYAPNGTGPQMNDPTSFAARAHGFPDHEVSSSQDTPEYSEPVAGPAIPRRRESKRHSREPAETYDLPDHGVSSPPENPEYAEPMAEPPKPSARTRRRESERHSSEPAKMYGLPDHEVSSPQENLDYAEPTTEPAKPSARVRRRESERNSSEPAKTYGLPDHEVSSPQENLDYAEPTTEPAKPSARVRRQESERQPRESVRSEPELNTGREVSQPSSIDRGVPIHQPRVVEISAQPRIKASSKAPLEEEAPLNEPVSDLTSPPIRSSTRKSSAGQADPRKEWASDRSPLQKLEVKLNDISKEEKRARVEKAEHKLRESQAKEDRRRTGQEPQKAPDRTSSRRASAMGNGKDDGLLTQKHQNDDHRWDENRFGKVLTPTYVEDIDRQQLERNQASSRDYDSKDPEVASKMTRPRGLNEQPSQPPSSNAVSDHHPGRGVRFHGQEDGQGLPSDPESGVGREQTSNHSGAIGHNVKPQDRHREDQLAMGARTSKEVPKQQQALYSGRTARSGKADNAATFGGAPDPISAELARGQSDAIKYEIPYQSAAGIEARQKVGFGGDPAGAIAAPARHKHHLSDILHHGRENAPNLEPQLESQPRHLEEWRQGDTARLTAADLKVDESNDPNAWWEQGASGARRAPDSAQAQRGPGTKSVSYAEDYGQESRGFDPPLHLKCGPLLRYTGLKRQKLHASRIRGNSSSIERESWRGSVMIVTIDGESDYSTPPTLRLFPEPIELLLPPPQQVNGESEHSLPPEYIDPIAGLPKLSRTGSTVYVKPVEDLEHEVDLSRIETDDGLFEETRTANVPTMYGKPDQRFSQPQQSDTRKQRLFSKTKSKSQTVRGVRLHTERGVTFWRFNLEVELGSQQTRIAYSINNGVSVGFWVPATGQSMNVMFHSCNGFSMSVNPANFSGPDPLWRDVLNSHQTRPFHVMIGGGDQIYNDAVMSQTTLFQEWLNMKSPHNKHDAPFSSEMQEELESFYLDRYSMWFSQGLFGMANSQIPMVNIWDDHDIIDGFGSYPHHFMSTPVFCGLGAVAFKYYMLFQHQSVPTESSADEPSWLLGAAPGPYINELSRNVYMSLGKNVAFLGLDCRTERTRDMIMSQASYELIFDRCRREILQGETKHLILLLGVPIAYPRLVWLENLLTSRVMDPIKALGRTGLLGGFLNKFDGGVEILDDLDDHWTAKNHKQERNYFIEELQELAAEKSVRVTILGGDVHLAAVGQFYSNPKLGIRKDRDHRYMTNIISSAIVNTPPPDVTADILNKRNKTHHFDHDTEEDMISMFLHDVDGKARNNKRLLPRRNWCSIREYHPGSTPPATPSDVRSMVSEDEPARPGPLQRTLSLTKGDMKPGNLIRRLSQRGPSQEHPPSNEYRTSPTAAPSPPQISPGADVHSLPKSRPSMNAGANGTTTLGSAPLARPGHFRRRPTNMSIKALKKGGPNDDEDDGHVNLEHGLDIVINCEVNQKDPAGATSPYRLLVPALWYQGKGDINEDSYRKKNFMQRFSSLRSSKRKSLANNQGQGNWGQSQESYSMSGTPSEDSEQQARQDAGTQRGGAMGLIRRLSQGASGRRRPNNEPERGEQDEVAGGWSEGMGPFSRRPSTRDAPRQQPFSNDEEPRSGQADDRVEGMGLFNRRSSNAARNGSISHPQTQPRDQTFRQGPVTTTTTTNSTQGGQQQQPQRHGSTSDRVEGMGFFPRRATSTKAQPSSQQQQPQPQSQPLGLRTMEARASQQQQRDFERNPDGYPGRRPSKLDRVLGIGHARDEEADQNKRNGPRFAARHGGMDGADEQGDDYYSGDGESFSEMSAADEGTGRGYGGIEAYKEQKGWRKFF